MPRSELIAFRRGTAAQWAAANPVLAVGEPGYVTDTKMIKVGDGVTAFTALDLAASPYDGIPLTSSDFVADAAATPGVVNNVPGWTFADAASQGIVTAFPIPAHWNVFFLIVVWCKLGAASGNVRWHVQMKDPNLFVDILSVAPFVDELQTIAAPGTVELVTGSTFAAATVIPTTFAGAFYTLRIERLGADAADTLAASVFVPTVLVARAS
jgi:hypothetical protein